MSSRNHNHGRSGRYSSNGFSGGITPDSASCQPEFHHSAGSLGSLAQGLFCDTPHQNPPPTAPNRCMSSCTYSSSYAQSSASFSPQNEAYSSYTGLLSPGSPLPGRGKPEALDSSYIGQSMLDDYETVVVDRVKDSTISDSGFDPQLDGHRRPPIPEGLPDQPQALISRRDSATLSGMGSHLDQRRHCSDCTTFHSDPLIFGNSGSSAPNYDNTLSMSLELTNSTLSDSLVMNIGSAQGSVDDYTDGRQGSKAQVAQSQSINSAPLPNPHQTQAFNTRSFEYGQSLSSSHQPKQASISRQYGMSASAARNAYTDQSQVQWEQMPPPISTNTNTQNSSVSYPAGISTFTRADHQMMHGDPRGYDVGFGGNWEFSSAWHPDYASSPPPQR